MTPAQRIMRARIQQLAMTDPAIDLASLCEATGMSRQRIADCLRRPAPRLSSVMRIGMMVYLPPDVLTDESIGDAVDYPFPRDGYLARLRRCRAMFQGPPPRWGAFAEAMS